MRNLAKFLAAFLATTFVACEDVPAPYEIFGGGNQNTEVTSLYYSSSNLYTGWELRAITPEQPIISQLCSKLTFLRTIV